MASSSKEVFEDPAKILFWEMCIEILVKSPKKDRYKELLTKYLFFPVAISGKEISVTWMNEGRNDFIRNMLNGPDNYAAHVKAKAEGKQPSIKRVRKSPV